MQVIKKKYFLILLLFILILLFFCLNQSFLTYNRTQVYQQMEIEVYNVTKGKNVIQNSDNFEGENWDKISADKDINQKLMKFHEMLIQSNEFEYAEFILTQIYSYDPYFQSDTNLILSEQNEVKMLYGYNVGENVDKLFSLETQNNQWFSKEDYFYSDGDTIPIILGNNYQKYYSVGDVLPLVCSGLSLNCKVIDFLKPQSKIVHNSAITELDNHILVPFQNFSEEKFQSEDKVNLQILYLNKNNGLIFTQLPTEKVKEIVLDYAKTAGLSEDVDIEPYAFIDNVANIKEISQDYFTRFMTYLISSILLTLFILVLFPLHLSKQEMILKKSLSSKVGVIVVPLLIIVIGIVIFWMIYKLSFVINLPFIINLYLVPTIIFGIICSAIISIISILLLKRNRS